VIVGEFIASTASADDHQAEARGEAAGMMVACSC